MLMSTLPNAVEKVAAVPLPHRVLVVNTPRNAMSPIPCCANTSGSEIEMMALMNDPANKLPRRTRRNHQIPTTSIDASTASTTCEHSITSTWMIRGFERHTRHWERSRQSCRNSNGRLRKPRPFVSKWQPLPLPLWSRLDWEVASKILHLFLRHANASIVKQMVLFRTQCQRVTYLLRQECAVDPGFIHKSRLSVSCMNLQWLTPYVQVR